ncbi:hypothetical protein FUSO7_00425 [Fusobacterium necrophorum BFTR-2]|nr:DUF262 domain-containing protein [Fusobacterium necrophorum]KDE74914.1 hypothetical protein FUSO7_00425 [Fusobacterium necrophorum BFTR-2]
MLLGIPLPPLFISVKNGKWEIIDGVQRISTLLWFYGKLNDQNHSTPLILTNLEILDELNGKNYLQLKEKYPDSIFKYFEFRRVDLNLLVSDSVESEYELFNRLNTGGIQLSAQEIRNFLFSKLNLNLYNSLKEFKDNEISKAVLTVSKKQISEDYEMELLIYFFIIINSNSTFDNEIGENIFERESKKYNYSRDKFIDVCITKILQNKSSITDMKYLEDIFTLIKKEVPKRPFANGRKFSPFLYICVISFIHHNFKKKFHLPEIIKKIEDNPIYRKKANRGTNVVDQFIIGIKIGKGILNGI